MAISTMSRVSKRLVLSYVLDWAIIIATAVVAAIFSIITPNKHPFSLNDPGVSFPFKTKETISTALLGTCALVIPAGIIAVICLFFIPGPTVEKGTPKRLIWQRKLWELNTGLLGLCLSCAAAFLLTNGSKNIFGKLRPDAISRCQPDLANISKYVVSGVGAQLQGYTQLVSADICMNKDKSVVDDGFRSFPSGHSSLSWAGLFYLTLFLSAKFAITIPYLAPKGYAHSSLSAFSRHRVPNGAANGDANYIEPPANAPVRNKAAAPPIYLLVVAVIPIGAATFISATRYSDYRHHGFDILFGAIMGFVVAWLAFRWYHLPIRQGAGHAWGARSRDRAFGIGVGVGSYVGGEGQEGDKARDLEHGPMTTATPTADGAQGGNRHEDMELDEYGHEVGYGANGPVSDSSQRGLRK